MLWDSFSNKPVKKLFQKMTHLLCLWKIFLIRAAFVDRQFPKNEINKNMSKKSTKTYAYV